MKKRLFSFVLMAILMMTLINTFVFNKETKEVEFKNEMKFASQKLYNISFYNASMTPEFDPSVHEYTVVLKDIEFTNGTFCEYSINSALQPGGASRQLAGFNGCNAAYTLDGANTKVVKVKPYYNVCNSTYSDCSIGYGDESETYTFTIKNPDFIISSQHYGEDIRFTDGITRQNEDNTFDVYLKYGIESTTSSCKYDSLQITGASTYFKEFQGCGLTYILKPGETKTITIKEKYQCGYNGCDESNLTRNVTVNLHRPLDTTALLKNLKVVAAKSKSETETLELSPEFDSRVYVYKAHLNYEPIAYAISGETTAGVKLSQSASELPQSGLWLTTRGEYDRYTYTANMAISMVGPASSYYGKITTFRDITFDRLKALYPNAFGTEASYYESKNSSIIEVGSDRLIAKKNGTTTIYYKVGNSVASIDITVKLLVPEKKADLRIVKKISIQALRDYLNSLNEEVKLYTDISEAPYLTNLSQTYTYNDLTIDIEDPSIAHVEGDYIIVDREGITNITLSNGSTSINYLMDATTSYNYQSDDAGIVLLTDDGYYEQSAEASPIVETKQTKSTEKTSNPKTGVFDSLGLILIIVLIVIATSLTFINKKTGFKEI